MGDRTGAWSREHECSSTGAVELICRFDSINFLSISCWHHFVVDVHQEGSSILSEIVDPALLASPELLLAQVAGHEGQRYYFLFQALFNFFLRRQLYDGFVFV